VTVAWGNAQFGQSVGTSVKLSSFLFPALQPPDPLLISTTDADAGTFTLTGTLSGVSLNDAHFWYPYSHGEIESRFVHTARGSGQTMRSQVRLNSGALTGCTLSNSNATADCSGANASSLADDDAGTPPQEYEKQTASDGAHTIGAGSPLSVAFGALGAATAESTARSHAASACTAVLGNDSLPFQCSDTLGPASASAAFTAGPVSGSLFTTSGVPRATATGDRTDSGGSKRVTSQATTSLAATDLVTLQSGPIGFLGAVRIGAATATATATAGVGAAVPTVTGAPFTVQIYDTTSLIPGYKNVTITPGVATTASGTATVSVGASVVSLTTSVTSAPKVTSSTSNAGAVTSAEASITNWLVVSVHVIITTAGTTQADLTVELDYGRLDALARYEPVT